jgi:hypothetical protein
MQYGREYLPSQTKGAPALLGPAFFINYFNEKLNIGNSGLEGLLSDDKSIILVSGILIGLGVSAT